VSVDYTLGSRLPTTATGKVSLGFDLQSDNGWHTLQPLATAPLRGGKAHLSGSLDLPSIERTAASVDAQTGVRSTRYTLGIVASIATEGTVGGTPISSAYAPRLTYALDKNRLLLVRSSPTEDPFAQSRVGSGLVNRANDFGLGIANLTIHSARTLAGWATALALIALIAAFALGRTRNDEPSRLAWQYGEWLIPIRGLPQTASAVTDVSEFASLVRLADRHNKAILHLDEEGEHTYLVKENGLLYRYTAHDPALTRRALRPAMPDRPNSV
jgi:hypothetical protein